MTTKEKVIIESMKRNTEKINKLNFLMEANPLSRICELREKAKKLFDENQGFKKRTSKDFVSQIDKLVQEEKKMFKIAKQQKDMVKIINEKIELEHELIELKNELYYANNS